MRYLGVVLGIAVVLGVFHTWRSINRDLARESTLSWLRVFDCKDDKPCLKAIDERYDECFAQEYTFGLFDMMDDLGGAGGQLRTRQFQAAVKACLKN